MSHPYSDRRWHIWIDRGGTFTDLVALSPEGQTVAHKLLSENPERYADAAIQGIRDLLGVGADEPIESDRIAVVKMGTTVATNALLERKGDRTVLLITQGFRDALRIGYQNRPDLFAQQIQLPELLYEEAIEVQERLSAKGQELQPVNREALVPQLQAAYDRGIRSCAIALLHGYRYPQHEQDVAQLAKNMGFTQISVSHQVSPLIKLVSRGDTTVVDAYLSPILRRYVNQVQEQLTGESGDVVNLMFMQSNGGLVDAEQFQGKDSILSGPAGGIVGAVQTSAQAGFEKIITFDMGGTSTDVAHYNGEYERQFDTEIAGVRVRSPMMAIHTVAAGGSSVVFFDGSRYRVGPDSAGANPGPVCYRRGGPLTITDCNVLLGKLNPRFFPAVFGSQGNRPLDGDRVREQFQTLAQEIQKETGDLRISEQVATGFIAIAIENMANAIKKISLQRGYDVSGYTLCCFGGAGGQHACQLADTLGIRQIVIHPYAGVLSAYGMGLADIRIMREQTLEEELTDGVMVELQDRVIPQLVKDAQAELSEQSGDREEIMVKLHLKYEGSDTPLLVNFSDSSLENLKQEFEHQHQQRYGFTLTQKPLVVDMVSVEIVQTMAHPEGEIQEPVTDSVPPEMARVPVYCSIQNSVELGSVGAGSRRSRWEGDNIGEPALTSASPKWQYVPVYDRQKLQPGHTIIGPALIIEPTGTNVIESGWQAQVHPRQHLVLTAIHAASYQDGRAGSPTVSSSYPALRKPAPTETGFVRAGLSTSSPPHQEHRKPAPIENVPTEKVKKDPVLLEIFNNLFGAIAEQMGVTLQNTAVSVNIKERLDFSCALFDPEGNLVANAPHIPVHLGSMSESVKALIQDKGNQIKPGEVYLSNNPYNGGTHLPDITAITPVFLPQNPIKPSFYVASRGHHADLGGITPGSMPPHSQTITEEGILFDNFLLVTEGRFEANLLIDRLLAPPYPARNYSQNLADLQAQIAANNQGVRELVKMVNQYGLETVQSYMGYVQDNAEQAVRSAIAQLSNGEFTYEFDNGAVIHVTITVDREQCSAAIDFTGTSAQLPNNFNAPKAVCQAAVLYVFRTLVDDPIPLNAGCLKPLNIKIPEGSMLNPHYPAAVVAGNVETSQAIVDTLYGALELLAASQGTMNNFTFGNPDYQYYETICGGSGAGPTFHGTDAVHTHMTNSRLTDPEVLEHRFPVRLEEFAIRPQSGGKGQFCGGNGIVRRIQFLEPMTAGILSNHRKIPPFGLAGGEPGAVGRNWIERKNGYTEELDSTATVELDTGEKITIETPGGGGWGVIKNHDLTPNSAQIQHKTS
ncbi:MAG: hydantoinase B/oxoprolinase family protein [Roseofilum sp. Belize BBD 4]|uniref:hydantoinase B/oxoprolinase family protein n=1 Tax=Roseofilum sp. Belize BBD 4 TaxID=2821500 RepID=UPI001B1F0B35|nr:hydantoinase B/oxoprolinase family protein [Roseofilum sp. Belize BBD 4]MBP0031918.1 hydantoinase B/oxoprolinase family protein [Roseofilum sp. Belize BBD 4]